MDFQGFLASVYELATYKFCFILYWVNTQNITIETKLVTRHANRNAQMCILHCPWHLYCLIDYLCYYLLRYLLIIVCWLLIIYEDIYWLLFVVIGAAHLWFAGEIHTRPSSHAAWGGSVVYKVPVTTESTYRCVGRRLITSHWLLLCWSQGLPAFFCHLFCVLFVCFIGVVINQLVNKSLFKVHGAVVANLFIPIFILLLYLL